MFNPTRLYTIRNNGKIKTVSSRKMAFDTVKKYYPDICKGEYYNPTTLKFFSQKSGVILVSWE